jgi:signal transduction histidine kinase
LLLAMTPSALVQALNFSLSMGWLPMRAGYPLAAPLSLLTMTPLLLLSLMQRSRELHTKLMLSQAINQTRTAFLAQISHDLRAPLNAVLGYARALTRPNSKLSTGDAALAIDHAGQRLLALIDEILDFAQGQANKLKLDPAPVHWATLVQDLSHYGTELAAQNGNRFVLKSGAVHSEGSHRGLVTDVLLDERRLRHVLDNLLSNASHYTAGGTVTLSCQADLLPGQIASLCFVVSDTGIGIAPEEKESVFEPFVRGASALRGGVKGTGLGLAIARQITQLMGGSLSLESQLGSGSRFTLNLSCPNLAPPNPLTQHSSFAELPLRCTTAPPDLVDLKELVYQGAVTDILHWAETLAKQQPAHAYFAAQVRQAALAVDFSTLRGLISAADLHAPS